MACGWLGARGGRATRRHDLAPISADTLVMNGALSQWSTGCGRIYDTRWGQRCCVGAKAQHDGHQDGGGRSEIRLGADLLRVSHRSVTSRFVAGG